MPRHAWIRVDIMEGRVKHIPADEWNGDADAIYADGTHAPSASISPRLSYPLVEEYAGNF